MALHSRSDSIQTHHQILKAACSLAGQVGPQGLTIDGVAREAGMSKGGVLYHFPSKEALVLGLIKLHLSSTWEGLRRHWKSDDRKQGRWHRAWIRATFESLREVDSVENASLFAIITQTPEILTFLRRKMARMARCLSFDGLDSDWSQLLTSSVAGLRFTRIFHLSDSSESDFARLEIRSLEMLEQILLAKAGSNSQVIGD